MDQKQRIVTVNTAQGEGIQPRAPKPKGVRWNLGEEGYRSMAPQTKGVA